MLRRLAPAVTLVALTALPAVVHAEDFPAPAPKGDDTAPAARAEASPFEAPPQVTVADVLPAALVKDAHHTVRPKVGMDRLQHTYEIESRFGVYRVTSRRMVEIRAHEIAVLERVTRMEGGPEFLKSLGQSLAAIPTGAVQLVLDPVDGFKKIGRGLSKTGNRIKDLVTGGQTSKYEGSTGGNALYGDEQREIAAELGLDVYSTNPQVREFLREIGGARAAGSLGVDLASLALPVVGFAAVTTAKWQADVTRLLRDKTPLELWRHNARVLMDLGIPRTTWEPFLRNRNLSPRHKTTITRSLVELQGVKDPGAILEAATLTRDEVGALYHEQQAILLSHVHREGGGLTSLRRVEHVVLGTQPVGREVVFLPVDHVYWMQDFARLVEAIRPAPGAKHATRMHVRGRITPIARTQLTSRGFELVDDFDR